jgi:hypothetical protein
LVYGPVDRDLFRDFEAYKTAISAACGGNRPQNVSCRWSWADSQEVDRVICPLDNTIGSTPMKQALGIFSYSLADHDLVRVKIVGAPSRQIFRAMVERVYSTGKGAKVSFAHTEIEFVGGGGAWGNEELAVGERALVFLNAISGRLYEKSWRGHMVLEEIDGEGYAIFQAKEIWLNAGFPVVLRKLARQDPRRAYGSAIRFDVLESYLVDLIEIIDEKRLVR